MDYLHGDVTEAIFGAAVQVHRVMGPGLLESVYEACLAHELSRRGIAVQRQVEVAVEYDGIRLDCGFRIDLLVASKVIVELKSVEKLMPIHETQLLTYLRLSRVRVGLLMNFNCQVLVQNVKRRVV
ncbi:MAG: GxxExxY protein [Tepidisphaera sp.]